MIAYAVSSKSDREKNSFRAYLDDLRILRTYNNPSGAQNPGLATDYQIWQVAQATAAAPTYFPPAKIDGEEFLDGGFGANNPSYLAAQELLTIHDTNEMCFVSIGSGGGYRSPSRRRSSQFGRLISLLKTAIESMTDPGNVNGYLLNLAKTSEKLSYFRFDIPGLEHIAMDQLFHPEGKHTIAFIRAQTQEYLSQTETRKSIHGCARMIVESRCRQEFVPPISSGQTPTEGIHRHLNNVPIPRNNAFCGREEILENMYTHLKPRSKEIDPRLQTCVLYGLGGIGKTQIAVEYCYRHKREYGGIFLIRASTEATLAEGYGSILKLIEPNHGTTDTETTIQVVNQWLSTTGKMGKSLLFVVNTIND